MTPRRILVIDDEEGIQLIIQVTLEASRGWAVLTAASGREGIATARREQPDAILLDVMMPDLDGIATFQQLQADAATQDIPVILLTAKARNQEREQLLALGVAGIITKPFEPESLVSQIRAILRWPNNQPELAVVR